MKFKRLCAVLLGFVIWFFVPSISTSATYLNYQVSNYTGYVQGKSNWCWAASAVASGRHANPSSYRTQSQVVKFTKGIFDNSEAPNVQANIYETAIAATYASLNNAVYYGYDAKLNVEPMVQKILQDRVTILQYGYYFAGERISGHMVTIVRYETYTNTTTRNVYVYDPKDGVTYSYNHMDLYNGEIPFYIMINGEMYECSMEMERYCYY